MGVQGELSHDGSQLGQVSVVIQGRQVVEKLQGSHQSLRSWRVHEVEVNQIVDAELFELNDDSAQVRPQYLRVGVILHLVLVSLLCVEPETFPRPGSPSSASSLLGGGLADWGH